MTPRVDSTNRVLLIVFGLIFLLGGLLLLLLSGGVFGTYAATSAVVPEQATLNVQTIEGWLWPVLAVLMLVVAGLAAWWVLAQLRTQTATALELERSPAGNIIVAGAALAECIEQDCESIASVSRARARVVSTTDLVQVSISVWIGAPYNINAVIGTITNDVLPHLAASLDNQAPRPIETTIHIETTAAPVSRLR